MKKLTMLMVMFAVLWLAHGVNADCLVHTTFEEDSAGSGTWDASIDYGWDEPDIASGINWTQGGSDTQVRFATSGAYSGSQCGRIIGSSTGSKYAYLDFGNKNNTGTYTVNWYARHKSISSTSGDRCCYVKVRDDDNDTAAEVQMSKDSSSISYRDSSGWHTLMTLVDSTWYEFKLKLNYQTKKFNLSARKAGIGASWTTVSNKSFYSASSTSIDRIYFVANKNKSYGYWDDISVVNGLAFPTAEGAGMFAQGGRGGDVYHVTNLSDDVDNPAVGSLRYGLVNTSGHRTIVFDISGTIYLDSQLLVENPYITIAGQTAPGDGICLANYGLRVCTNDVIIRYLRSRTGDNMREGNGGEWLLLSSAGFGYKDRTTNPHTLLSATDGIMDHCSLSWGVHLTFVSCLQSHRITCQWCILSESLYEPGHDYAHDGYASLIRGYDGSEVTLHHNLFAHHKTRAPRPGNYENVASDPDGLNFDFRNNIIYHCGNDETGYSGYNADGDDDSLTKMNYVGNYLKEKPGYNVDYAYGEFTNTARSYFSDNYMNGYCPSDPWSLVLFDSGHFTQAQINAYKQNRPFPAAPVATDSTVAAYNRILDEAGAIYPERDSVDDRIVSDVENGTGSFIADESDVGGWPTLYSTTNPTDSDGDGMPNYWENDYGLNPNSSADRNYDNDQDGYTNLEEYLSWLVDEGDGPNGGDGPLPMEGDVTGDGHVNIDDVSLIYIKAIIDPTYPLTEEQLISADTCEEGAGAGTIDIDDVVSTYIWVIIDPTYPLWQEEYDLGVTIPPMP
ncbi:MAG: hypothetical protein K8R02_06220 [Anaerohalosphaeraceae bacterium]|nr:hypothetical protein [Anaerohalosphaeraceae bacterium]